MYEDYEDDVGLSTRILNILFCVFLLTVLSMLAALVLSGCSWVGSRLVASVETTTTTGTMGGEAVDTTTTTIRKEQEESKETAQVDVGALLRTATAALTGQMQTLLTPVEQRLNTVNENLTGLENKLPSGNGGAAEGIMSTLLATAWATREALARRAENKRQMEQLTRTEKDRDKGWDMLVDRPSMPQEEPLTVREMRP